MAHVYDKIDESLTAWIREQPMWFVATAPLAAGGQVNRSPRGHDSFSILGARRVGWVDYTGSGVETIAHLRENGRVCLMFASFGPRPRIVRLHGTGMVHLPGTSAFAEVAGLPVGVTGGDGDGGASSAGRRRRLCRPSRVSSGRARVPRVIRERYRTRYRSARRSARPGDTASG
ncbi:pyridoxamine 5'-phosphate oxidase family protein [Rathayibacter rathayi]|uniref:Pyridoxamine 5'-phosphate oxidase family protein n=1 Tax=Rathayibacter rathayi TaxID=33887 RepID=A0ABD6W6R7_RATRA|nr:pyridoxamine 5'-phosphate oxidase family protein [Rathayibacter rathayi]AZZ49481.1 pyridoxamine 5'-phosphate oxidase family protein [Rathayibacter rathayi]MWV73592.1 hypothetical protein [Rathayibacter rathayi NCPPB 2980 = VKM Ac-1601]PPF11723.1 pyridoxamine 5'-phosphate oxidase family protein [Rathayibacter rathayi]PPF22891.1 pyridoxamine 5'-phosphate oxidase family protein [Rathayibacter rathayi]PPF47809.1 pyridoxamine 5'-phosphate oxidase family protein [Rathayibacter rathayi]